MALYAGKFKCKKIFPLFSVEVGVTPSIVVEDEVDKVADGFWIKSSLFADFELRIYLKSEDDRDEWMNLVLQAKVRKISSSRIDCFLCLNNEFFVSFLDGRSSSQEEEESVWMSVGDTSITAIIQVVDAAILRLVNGHSKREKKRKRLPVFLLKLFHCIIRSISS